MSAKKLVAAIAAVFVFSIPSLRAETVVDINGVGTAKFSVTINVSHPMFSQCLAKNLELSGLFKVGPNGSIRVHGAPGAIVAEGSGKPSISASPFTDDRSARMSARKLADAMVSSYSNGQQKGFALDKIIFLDTGKPVAKNSARPSELCVTYPDGFDIRKLTSDAKMTVYPRWMNQDEVTYISDRNGAPQVWQMNTMTGKRFMKWSFKGSPAGVAVSPDGTKFAAILSFQGNPELYILQGGNYIRLTNTPLASEGQPCWSPDGRKIAFVSDETRHPQIYVIDIATKQKRRLTSRGSQNTDPDWGKDGRITYITRRGGAYVAVMTPADGDKGARLVTDAANWEHPSWARDARHVVANRNGALFSIDTVEGGDQPRQIFHANGNWNSASWAK